MRIFLSYAAEQRAQAEEFHRRLTNDGHDVFWDHEDLEAGAAYDAAIRGEIESCDAFVFLISPESVADKSYALAELAMIFNRWRVPAGRVIPVMVSATPLASLPAYLKSVTIPQDGDPIASMLAALTALARRMRRRRIVIGSVGVAVAVAAGVLVSRLRARPEIVDDLRVETHVARTREGVLTGGDGYELHLSLRNESAAPVMIEELAGDFDDERFHFVGGDSSVLDRLTIGAKETWSGVLPFRLGFPLEHRFLRDHEIGSMRWRLRWTRLELPQLTAWRAWAPRGEFTPAPARELDVPFAMRVRRLVRAGSAFAAVLADPPELLVCYADGRPRASIPLEALPSCLESNPALVLIGFAESHTVIAIDVESGKVAWREFVPATRLQGGYAELATRPVSLAMTREAVWVATDGDGAGAAVLVRVSAANWRLHPAVANGTVSLSAYTLKTIDDVVWGVPTNEIPTHPVRFTTDSAYEVNGHDDQFVFASDLHDVAPGFETGTLLFCTPANSLVVVRFDGDSLHRVRQFGAPIEFASPITSQTDLGRTWQEERLVRRGAEALAYHWTRSVLSNSPLELQLVRFHDGAPAGELLFEAPGCALVDVAAAGDQMWFAAIDDEQRTHLLALR